MGNIMGTFMGKSPNTEFDAWFRVNFCVFLFNRFGVELGARFTNIAGWSFSNTHTHTYNYIHTIKGLFSRIAGIEAPCPSLIGPQSRRVCVFTNFQRQLRIPKIDLVKL